MGCTAIHPMTGIPRVGANAVHQRDWPLSYSDDVASPYLIGVLSQDLTTPWSLDALDESRLSQPYE